MVDLLDIYIKKISKSFKDNLVITIDYMKGFVAFHEGKNFKYLTTFKEIVGIYIWVSKMLYNIK